MLTFDIQFNYSMDDAGFFNDSGRRDQLERAAAVFESRITDTLDAITPGGVNSWIARPRDPETGVTVDISNLVVPADTVIVYVGARNLGGSLGSGGPGGFSSSGTGTWLELVETRGESGVDTNNSANTTDLAPWGGTLTFNNTTTWHYGNDLPSAGENDFYSVAVHELGHLLGIGTEDSWDNLVNGSNQFTGTTSVAANGGNVALHGDSAHFAANTQSTIPGTATQQEAALDPDITVGTRKELTVLDWAALDDIGWEVTPVIARDYGDAPDISSGTGTGNYNTLETDSGPSHGITGSLFIGTTVDGDLGDLQNGSATADDTDGSDDEDGIASPGTALSVEIGTTPAVTVIVTNNSGSVATLTGWIDLNNDGIFSNATERAQVQVSNGTVGGSAVLNFPAVPNGYVGSTFARFRLSTDNAADSPTGAASDGEVEDYAASIVSPETTDTLPTFQWAAVQNATKYELVVDNLSLPQNDVILQSNLQTTRFTAHEALPTGDYVWRYRAFVNGVWQAFSSNEYFTVANVAGQIQLTDPVISDTDSSPTFAWNSVQNATRYELWVNDVTNGISRIVHRQDLTTTSYKPFQGLGQGTYRAWVRAFDGNTPIGGWSSSLDMTISATAGTPQILDPTGDSSNSTPLFTWTPTTNASRYELWVNDVTNGVSRILRSQFINQAHFQSPVALAAGTYRAWVRSNVVGSGWTAWSTPVDFNVTVASGQASVTGPFGSGTQTLPTFSWTPVTNATRYELWVNDVTNSVARRIHRTDLTTTSFTPRSALTPGTYRTWVRAFNGNTAIGGWSSLEDYTVVESSTGALVMTPNSDSTSTLPRFSWVAEADTSRYELWVNDVTNSVARVVHETNLTTTSFIPSAALNVGEHRVWVRSFDLSNNPRPWSAPVGFDIRLATTTTLVNPTVNETIAAADVVFAWTQTAEATGNFRYELWVNDDTRSIARVVHETNLTTNSFVPGAQLLAGDYRAWIRLFDNAGNALAWSPVVSFTVAQNQDADIENDNQPIFATLRPIIEPLPLSTAEDVAPVDTSAIQPTIHAERLPENRHTSDAAGTNGNTASHPNEGNMQQRIAPNADITRDAQMWANMTDLLMADFALIAE